MISAKLQHIYYTVAYYTKTQINVLKLMVVTLSNRRSLLNLLQNPRNIITP